ncbi:MAG TPA: outer membrane beta-barrel domain-containing protein [Polyangia bacterium]|jgi:outer membrane beta-barrel protein
MNMNADLNPKVTRRSEKDMPMTTTNRKSFHRRLAFFVALAVTAVPLAAQAQRKSPLADAPAIRKRYELRAARFEIGAGFGSTVNQDFYHTMFFNLKLAGHINDWLSIAGVGSFAVANIATTYQSNITGTLTDNPPVVSEPSKNDAISSMQKISAMYALQAEFTPFTGKYSLFGKLFANYDFYAFGGLGVITVAPTDSGIAACSGNNTAPGGGAYFCGVSGTKFGPTFGLGLHSYFNHWMALNVELRDILAKLNPSGRDTNVDLQANNADLTWTNTYSLAANLVFYLPATPSISP